MSWEKIKTDVFVSVQHLFEEADEETLCVFDVDQVLIDPKDVVLSAAGEAIKMRHLLQLQEEYPQEIYDHYYSILVKEREVDVVDPLIRKTIHTLQARQMPTIALTAFWDGPYGILENIGDFRVNQLLGFGYDFSKSQPLSDRQFKHLDSGREGYYPSLKKGIALTCYVSKGEVLKAYINAMAQKPKQVIFIDDRLQFVEQVLEACRILKIPCHAIHYVASEAKQHVLNEKLAQFQWDYFKKNKRWLSDEKALKLMHS